MNIVTFTPSTRRLRTQGKRLKLLLFASPCGNIEIDALYDGIDNHHSSITSAKFAELCEHEFEQCLHVASKVLQDGNIRRSDIDNIVFVGGSTRIPRILSMIKQYFTGESLGEYINREAIKFNASIQAIVVSDYDNLGNKSSIIAVDAVPLSI